MTPHKVSLLLAALVFATAGVGTAFAGDKAGAVNAVQADYDSCYTPGAQDNIIYGQVAVWLHDPNQIGADVTVTYQNSKTTIQGVFIVKCPGDGWSLYGTDIVLTVPGTATIEVFDRFSGQKIGGDGFRVVAPAN